MSQILGIVQFVAVVAMLIFVHELGHFLAAKLFKVEVEEFGIGFPPRLVRLFSYKGTAYTLNLLPFGGFVRLKGDYDPTVEGSLAAAKPWARIGVYLAGPLMNFLVAVLLYAIIISRLGIPDPNRLNEVSITYVVPGSPAEQAGLAIDDLVLQVNGETIDSTQKLHDVIYANLGKQVSVSYQRGGQTFETTLTPRDPPPSDGAIGIMMGTPIKNINPVLALPMGVQATYEYSAALLGMLGQVVSGKADSQEGRLVGYKGMYDIYSEVRNNDAATGGSAGLGVISFFTSITISLGLFNLLPLPAVDGGRIAFVLPEILLRKRIPPRFENVVNFVGFALLLLLLIFVNVQDFINPIQLPK